MNVRLTLIAVAAVLLLTTAFRRQQEFTYRR
jgi:hypothetical protein